MITKYSDDERYINDGKIKKRCTKSMRMTKKMNIKCIRILCLHTLLIITQIIITIIINFMKNILRTKQKIISISERMLIVKMCNV